MGLPEQATLGLTPKWRNEPYGWTSAKRALKQRGDQVKALLWDEASQPEVGVTGWGRRHSARWWRPHTLRSLRAPGKGNSPSHHLQPPEVSAF